VDAADVDRLAALQVELVGPLIELVRPGGMFVYSVCTMTAAETSAIDEHLQILYPRLVADPPVEGPWRPWGRGAIVLPQDADTDGMYILRLQLPE
jgi:16S rRNA (cytosine967-C5)-methyltransferase